MHVKRLLVVMAVLLALPFAALAQEGMAMMGADSACPPPSNLSGEITIGAIFGLSGSTAVYGVPQQQAVQLAVNQINEWGYLGEGVTLNVRFEDSPGEAEAAINAMTKLVEGDQVVAVLGPTLSSEAFAADPVAQENGTVVMGVSNTAIGITGMGDYVFRNSLPESAVIPGLIAQAVEIYGLERVGILYGNDNDFTVSGYRVFKQALEAVGVEIVAEETFARGDVAFGPQLTNLAAQNVDAIVVSALAAEAVPILIQARGEAGFEGVIIGGNGFNSPAVLRDAGEAANGLVVGAAWNIGKLNDLGAAFVDAYTLAYNTAPDQFAAQAYTGAWLMAEAIRCADSTDRAAVRDALAAIRDFSTPLGVFSFDENRDPVHDPVAQVVVDGRFTVLGAE